MGISSTSLEAFAIDISQLEKIGQMIKDRRDEEITRAVNEVSMRILEGLEPGFDHREVAQRISEAVGKILDEERVISS